MGLVLAVVVLLTVTQQASAASFFGLGDLPENQFVSVAHGVSADGSVVVGWSRGSSGQEAFIWDATNGMVGLGFLPGGGGFSYGAGVSGDGSVVVGISSSLSSHEAFIWDATNGAFTSTFLHADPGAGALRERREGAGRERRAIRGPRRQ
jgi:probable HAF family extracellular repeat protein